MTARDYDPALADDRRLLARALLDALTAGGFTRADTKPGAEIAMTRAIKHGAVHVPNTTIQVYTTIDDLGRTPIARAAGQDAIRVCAVYVIPGGFADKGRGLIKQRRVFRVGTIDAIVERTLERARATWRAVVDRPRCSDCGAPTFVAKSSGRDTCAATCWVGAHYPEPD